MSLQWKIKDCIGSLLKSGGHDGPCTLALKDIEAEVAKMEQELAEERCINLSYKEANVRLFDENSKLKDESQKKGAKIKELEVTVDKMEASVRDLNLALEGLRKEYNELLDSSRVIVQRLQKVAFGKKGERLWKIVGNKTKRLFEGFVAMVTRDSNPEESGGTGGNDPAVTDVSTPSHDEVNDSPAQQEGNGDGTPSDSRQDNGESTLSDSRQDNGESAPSDPRQDNGESAPSDSRQDNGGSAPSDPRQDNGGSAPSDPRQGNGESTFSDSSDDNGGSAPSDAKQDSGEETPSDVRNRKDGETTPSVDEEGSIISRLERFLADHSCQRFAYCFMPFDRTLTEMMDDYHIDYKEQKLWLISRGLLQAVDEEEEKEAESFKDKSFGYLIGRASYYPVLERRLGMYYPCICIVPEVTHQGSTLPGRHLSRLFRSSYATPSAVSYVSIRKYRQGLPFNVLSNEAIRGGTNISRGRMAEWLITAYEDHLWIFHEYLRQLCVRRHVLLMDETYGFAHGYGDSSPQFYFWGMCTSPLAKNQPVLKVYYQDKNRYGLVAAFLLRGFKGLLETDGYDGYRWLHDVCPDITLCSDWAHPRRKFVDVLPTVKILEQMTEEELKEVKELHILCAIARMFHIEQEFADYSPDERRVARQSEMKGLIESVISDCEEMAAKKEFDPGSEAGRAVMYVLDRKDSLERLLEDGEVTLSTNEIERSNIIVALVRKRAKYYGSEDGSRSAAGFFSIIESAEANHADPELFLEFLLTVLPRVMHEHENEVAAYREYLDKVRKLFDDAKDLHRRNPKAEIAIDWSAAGPEPALDFLSECLFDKDAFKAFVAMRKQEDAYLADVLVKAVTEFNFLNSPVSLDGMQKILSSSGIQNDAVFDDARSILEDLAKIDVDGHDRARFSDGLIRNLSISDTPYPERLIELLWERGLLPDSLMSPANAICESRTDDAQAIPAAMAEDIDQGSTMSGCRDHFSGPSGHSLPEASGLSPGMDPPCPEGQPALTTGSTTADVAACMEAVCGTSPYMGSRASPP